MYAHVTDGTVDQVGGLPQLVFADGRWWDLRPKDTELLATLGWYEVVQTRRPDDTPTETSDLEYVFADGTVTQVWVAREWTTEESAAALRAANEQALRNGLQAVITTALERQATVQAVIDTPNATIRDSPAPHIVAIARATKRQDRAIIRLARLAGDLLDSADTGTD